ncbi:glutamyl-tRNA reductase [Phaeacidiphilus oryzae]|uniref:glutamyl-tRNA reductase n=1 Tax=Phaeacidiphilus oryzae TaxID=348818 RepID=UPI00068BA34B|nr:glutamyl-tRNA reductase [Phaeacidiphilus oryzae]
MSLLVLGLSHRTAPVGLLERASLTGEEPVRLLRAAAGSAPVGEATLVATCNRIELYADVAKFHAGVDDLSALLAGHTGVELEELTPHLYVHYEDRAVHHLFSVACGLDSMVVGEGQILGQLRDALSLAQDEGTAGRGLNELFQQALRVGKRAHSETGIDRAGQSLVTFGLEQVAEATGPVERKRALVVGAGSMSSLAATTLARLGVPDLVIANRTPERAERLAAALDARTVPFGQVGAAMAEADLVISCTGAAGIVLGAEEIAVAVGRRAERSAGAAPLAVLDLAMPRDTDPGVQDLDGVVLVDLETLADAASERPGGAADVDLVRRLVDEELEQYAAAQRASRITPTVVALRTMAAEVVGAELERLDGRLPELDAKARAELKQTVHRVVDKLLHAPTVRVKQLASEPGGASYAEALRELFDLDPAAVRAVAGAPDPVRVPEAARETTLPAPSTIRTIMP